VGKSACHPSVRTGTSSGGGTLLRARFTACAPAGSRDAEEAKKQQKDWKVRIRVLISHTGALILNIPTHEHPTHTHTHAHTHTHTQRLGALILNIPTHEHPTHTVERMICYSRHREKDCFPAADTGERMVC